MRTALVTGGSSGIGLQFVKQLLDEGWKVITGSRNAENCGPLQRLKAQHADRLRARPATWPAVTVGSRFAGFFQT